LFINLSVVLFHINQPSCLHQTFLDSSKTSKSLLTFTFLGSFPAIRVLNVISCNYVIIAFVKGYMKQRLISGNLEYFENEMKMTYVMVDWLCKVNK